MLIQPKGLKLNTHNILYIINKGNTHFVTFKSDSVGQNQQLTELIQSSPDFINKLTKMISNRRLCVNLSEIDNEVKESRVNLYSFLLRGFDNTLFNEEVNEFRPHNYNAALRLQQKYNNTKMSRDLRNLHLSAAIDARLKQINNNAKMARELPTNESNLILQQEMELRLKQINNNAKMARELPAMPVKKKKMTIREKRNYESNTRKLRKEQSLRNAMSINELALLLALKNSPPKPIENNTGNEKYAHALAIANEQGYRY